MLLVRLPTSSRLVGINRDNTSDRTSLTTVPTSRELVGMFHPDKSGCKLPRPKRLMVRPGDRTSMKAGGDAHDNPRKIGMQASVCTFCAPGQPYYSGRSRCRMAIFK
ncbi:MAG: hypothetical protein ACI30J_02695 [Paludibacteraceae bacterium]